MLLTLFETEFAALLMVFETLPTVLPFDEFTFERFAFEVTFTLVFVEPQATARAVTVVMQAA
jgi:hypothetical protein